MAEYLFNIYNEDNFSICDELHNAKDIEANCWINLCLNFFCNINN